MNNKNRISKQTGGISTLMLVVIIGAMSYAAYFANKKGYVSSNSNTSIASKVKSTLSTSGDHSGYGVQIMATSELNQATTVMNDFAKDGYSSFVLANKNKGRTMYKVRLGPYEYRPEAIAIKDKVKKRYPKSPYLKTSFVIFKPN